MNSSMNHQESNQFESTRKKLVFDESENNVISQISNELNPNENGVNDSITRFQFSENEYYEGGFIGNDITPTGYGHEVYVNGDCYTGEFTKGKRNGIGEYFIKEKNAVYRGKWENGMKNGIGYLYIGDKCYRCEYKNDKLIKSELIVTKDEMEMLKELDNIII